MRGGGLEESGNNRRAHKKKERMVKAGLRTKREVMGERLFVFTG